MNHPFNLNSLSPFKNANEDESSSEDDSKDNYNYIDDLYGQIGAPIPLPEEKKPSSSDVRTGCKIHFVKLPETMYKMSNAETGSPNGIDKMIDDVSVSLQSGADDSKAIRAGISMAPQSLYGLYPRNDPRLVYLKYKDQGDWEEKRKYYASYLINLVNLVNNNTGIVQYRGEVPENNEGSIVKNTVTSLRFDAMFESGNLFAAYKVSEYEYDLILQNDINTRGNTQWFFFAVSNTLKGRTVKFNIVNLLKPDSLFNEGMKPAVFSNIENALKGEGWKRAGISASYYKNNISKEGMGNKTYYTLSFSYTFKHSDDTVYFAHSFPYTYSNLKEYLAQLCEDPVRKSYIVRKTLCLTLAKNECEYLSITSPYHLENIDKRCGIIVTARQHPGESLSSYMMEGFINFITSEEPEAQLLRKHCVFKIVPMLNPDGVIHGNYRTSLSGRDLNRIWNKPSPVLHPTIYYTKELVRRVAARRRLRLVCDLHGHSRKNNAFFYGNATEDNPYNPRVFPLVLSKISKYVSFEDSRFVIQKAKENTARIALWKELRIDNIFTLEASFYGYQQDGVVKHFTQEDYRNLGVDLARAAFIYLKDITLDIFTTPDPKSRVEDKKADEKPCEPPSKKQTEKDKKQFRRRRSLSMTNNTDDTANTSTVSKPAPFDKPLSPLRRNDSINCNSLVEELKSNRQLIAVGNNEGDSGSDTDNSEDEIPDKEINKVIPLKNVSRPKKKKRDMVKKKSTSIAPTRRDDKKEEEKEKLVPPTKVDSSTNTAPSQARADKNQAFVIKPKFPLRKMMRPPHLREKVFIAEPIQEAAGPVEMVSKGCQTEETWYYYLSEDQGTSLDRQLSHQNKSFDLPMESKGVSCPNVGQRRHKGSSNSSRSMKNKDAFMIVGEKTGIDSSSGIDVNYKLGRNQISRAVLAKFAPVFFGPEARRERMGLLGQAKKAEAARNEIAEHMARKPPSISTQKVEGGLSRNVTPVGQAPYFVSFKEGDSKTNILQDESTRETNIAMPRFEDARPRNRREIAHVRTAGKETKDSAEKRSISIKELSAECQTPRLNGVSQKRRATIKDKPPVPLPSLFRMHHGKSDLKEIATKEALATDISSFINNSRKAGSTEDTEEDSFVKGKLSKTPSNIGLVSHMSSYRDLVEKSDTKRDKNLLGPIKEYPVAGGIFQIPNKFVVKEQVKNNQRREKSNKPERLLLNDIKTDIEKKLGELDIASPKGRRSQNSNLRKI